MNEIEVKVKLDNPTDLIKKFKELGCVLSEPITQKDTIFLSKEMKEYKIEEGTIILRLREQNNKTIFTLKQQKKNALESREHETIIENPHEITAILDLLGYQPLIHVNKTRIKAKYKDYNLCIDHVEKLGHFAEVELLTDKENSTELQSEMMIFLQKLGIASNQRIFTPYDTMIYNLEH